MRKRREIEIEVSPDGEVKIEAIGFEGNLCDIEISKLTRLLGGEQDAKKKPEYYIRIQKAGAGNTKLQRKS